MKYYYPLTVTQLGVLVHLVIRGHAMTPRDTERETGHQCNVRTYKTLMDRGFIRWTDQGVIATDDGALRVKEI